MSAANKGILSTARTEVGSEILTRTRKACQTIILVTLVLHEKSYFTTNSKFRTD